MNTSIAQKWAQKKPLTFGNGVAAKGVFSAPELELSGAVGNVNLYCNKKIWMLPPFLLEGRNGYSQLDFWEKEVRH